MIKEAAQRLLDKGKITKNECISLIELEKQSGISLDVPWGTIKNVIENLEGDNAKAFTEALAKGEQKTFLNKIFSAAKPVALGGATAIGSAAAGKELIDYFKQKSDIANSYNSLQDRMPMLSEYPEDKIRDYFEVVKTYSPKSAANPLVAGALVHKMLEFGGVDHKLVQDISKIEDQSPSLFYEIAKANLGSMSKVPKDD